MSPEMSTAVSFAAAFCVCMGIVLRGFVKKFKEIVREEPAIDIKKVTFDKDDVIVLTSELHLSTDQTARLMDDLRETLPKHSNRVLLLTGGIELSVLGPKQVDDLMEKGGEKI